jgi:hypothetical protein
MWGRILGTILSATLIGDGPTAELALSEPWGMIARLGVGQPAERAAAASSVGPEDCSSGASSWPSSKGERDLRDTSLNGRSSSLVSSSPD